MFTCAYFFFSPVLLLWSKLIIHFLQLFFKPKGNQKSFCYNLILNYHKFLIYLFTSYLCTLCFVLRINLSAFCAPVLVYLFILSAVVKCKLCFEKQNGLFNYLLLIEQSAFGKKMLDIWYLSLFTKVVIYLSVD